MSIPATDSERFDPELIEPLKSLQDVFDGPIDLSDLAAVRGVFDQVAEAKVSEAAAIDGVTCSESSLQGRNGNLIALRIYCPEDAAALGPAMLWAHGGGMVLCNYRQDEPFLRKLCRASGVVIVSVNYRLAPEHPFPAAVNDCYDALRHLHENAESLGIDRTRIGVGGVSAGGGIAAGLALMVRDRGDFALSSQLLLFPMLDDRNVGKPDQEPDNTPVWTLDNNRFGWSAYLGKAAGESVSAYAAPLRATRLSDLPPCYLLAAEFDLFVAENTAYAAAMTEAGVDVKLDDFPNAYHAFHSLAPEAGISKTVMERCAGHLRDTLNTET